MTADFLLDGFQGGDIGIQKCVDVFRVGQADLLPHGRGGGGDPGNILKAPGGNLFHSAFIRVALMDQIDQ